MPRKGSQKATPARRAEFLKYLRTLGEGDECIYWPWSELRDQYVAIHVDGRTTKAHRWVYEQISGELLPRGSIGPGPRVAMHKCDNRACLRPSHVMAGTQLQNMRDGWDKGRMHGHSPVGVAFRTKLRPSQVEDIRRLASEGVRYAVLGRAYGVASSTIGGIVNGRTRAGAPHQKLWPEDVRAIQRRAVKGERQTDLAKEYNVSFATINLVVHRRRPLYQLDD